VGELGCAHRGSRGHDRGIPAHLSRPEPRHSLGPGLPASKAQVARLSLFVVRPLVGTFLFGSLRCDWVPKRTGGALHYGEDGDEWRQRMVDELVPDPPPGVVDSLAVIGNGFDLALGIPSSFTQFKEYFRLLVLGAQDIDAELADIYNLVDGVAGPGWQDFEVGLAELQLPWSVGNRDYPDPGDLSDLPELQHEADEFSESVRSRLSDTFTEWIHGLPSPRTQPSDRARKLIAESDAILTFNYTRTLEKHLGANPRHVLHIHGIVEVPALSTSDARRRLRSAGRAAPTRPPRLRAKALMRL